MKTLKIVSAIAALAAGIFAASAQPLTPAWAGYRDDLIVALPLDGTATFPANTTNTFWTATTTNVYNSPSGANVAANTNLFLFNIDETDDVGFTWAFIGTATSTNSLLIYPSYDKGRTYSTVPIWQANNIAPGAANFITNAALVLPDVTTLCIVAQSSGTTGSVSNLCELFLKTPKYGAVEVSE